MQWLITLETEQDMIITCRLMNVFRRKGLTIVTLAMATRPNGFSMVAVLESPEADVEHIFNFLRRMEGVQRVTYYRHEPSENAAFIFIDAQADSPRAADILKTFPESKLIFASHGKFLLEVPAESRRRAAQPELGMPDVLPFAVVKSTRSGSYQELAVA